MSSKKPKVLIGLPTMGSIHTFLFVIIQSWLASAFRNGDIDLGVYPTIGIQPVDQARNNIVEAFLKTDYTHLFFIDSDTMPPEDALKRLLAVDKPIVSGLTPIIEIDRHNEPYRKWNCVGLNDRHLEPNTGIKEAKGTGGSCLLIKREVLERMPAPHFRFVYEDDNGKTTLRGQPLMVSEDIYFIAKARGSGFITYCDTGVICRHAKTTLW